MITIAFLLGAILGSEIARFWIQRRQRKAAEAHWRAFVEVQADVPRLRSALDERMRELAQAESERDGQREAASYWRAEAALQESQMQRMRAAWRRSIRAQTGGTYSDAQMDQIIDRMVREGAG